MKTVTELNNKWWYRLVKVIFIGTNLIVVLVATFILTQDNKPVQVKDYKVTCSADYTNKKNFLAEKDADIFIYQYGSESVYKILTEDQKIKIKNLCDISADESKTASNNALDYIYAQSEKGTDITLIQRYVDANFRPYSIEETYIIKGSYANGVVYSFFALLVSLFVIEIARRIFYYIFLGTIKPSK